MADSNELSSVLKELKDSGFLVQTPAQLRVNYPNYDKAFPILLRWVVKAKDPDIKEDLVRNLTTKRAPAGSLDVLASELAESASPSLNWAICNAVGLLATKKDKDLLIKICRRWEMGYERQMVVSALAKVPGADTQKLLIDLLQDSTVKGHALAALAKIGDLESLPHIEKLLSDKNPWIKRKAATAIKAIKRKGSGAGCPTQFCRAVYRKT